MNKQNEMVNGTKTKNSANESYELVVLECVMDEKNKKQIGKPNRTVLGYKSKEELDNAFFTLQAVWFNLSLTDVEKYNHHNQYSDTDMVGSTLQTEIGNDLQYIRQIIKKVNGVDPFENEKEA